MFWFSILAIFILGLVVGSFITSYTHRVVRGKSVSKGRSLCPHCKNKISWYDNIPIISYILLGGKCRNCKKKISLRYPLIELATALLFILVYLNVFYCATGLQGLSLQSNTLCFWQEQIGVLALPYFLFITVSLIAIFVTDIEEQIIPDFLSYSLFVFSFLVLIIASPEDLYIRIFTGFALSLSFLLLHLITLGRGMGLGDVKLVIFAGILLSWKLSLVWVFVSFVIGAIVGVILIAASKAKFGKQIAFGPFLIVSFFLVIFLGDCLLTKLFPFF
jgi:prepilin signal peptidase PulO-like enzyme (type II secretory pathway)